MNKVCTIPQSNDEVTLTGNGQTSSAVAAHAEAGAESLGPIDFQRIGVPPQETRAAVIRTAASRASKSLAVRQLHHPNSVTEHQLSRVAVSAYRLLDPRQRRDRQSRAHVGRIRPGVLQQAGETSFAVEPQSSAPVGAAAFDVPPNHLVYADVELQPPETGRAISPSRRTDCSQPKTPKAENGRAEQRRPQLGRPSLIVALIILLLLAAAALWSWGQSVQGVPERLNPVSVRS